MKKLIVLVSFLIASSLFAFPPPENVQVDETGFVTWQPPDTDELIGYNVYLDGILETFTTNLSYQYTELFLGEYYIAGVSAMYDDPGESVIIEVMFQYNNYGNPFDPPSNPAAVVDDYNDVIITWEVPGADEWIRWDSAENENAIGITTSGTFYVASHWNPADLTDYDGAEITKIEFFPNELETFTIQIWTGPNAGTLVSSEPVTTVEVDTFQEVVLSNPVTIDASQELWFGYEIIQAGATHPAGTDDGPAVQEFGDMISLDGASWTGMSAAYGLDYNWNLAAYVEGSDGEAIVLSKPHKTTTKEVSKSLGTELIPLRCVATSHTRNTRSLTGYKIFRDGIEIVDIQNPATLTYTDESLDAGTYEYTLLAYYTNPDGESVLTDPVEATIVLDCPSNFNAQFQDPNVIVTWSAPVRDVDSYNIYRDEVLIAENITGFFYVDITPPPGEYIYSVTAVFDGGWESDSCDEIEVIVTGEPLVAEFEAIPTEGLFPLDVQFTDLSSGGLPVTLRESGISKVVGNDDSRDIVSWEWDFDNDGIIDSNEQNPLFTYTDPGIYTVSLTVSDGINSNTETKVDYITVAELITADFIANPLIGLSPLIVQFTDLSSVWVLALNNESHNSENLRDIVSWEWDFDNDGTIDSNEQNPLYTYTVAGIYTVSLTVSDGTNISTKIKIDYITVEEQLIAEFIANPLFGFPPLTVQFTDQSTGGFQALRREYYSPDNPREIISWWWDFNNDGNYDSTEQNPQWTYYGRGNYSVKLTVYDGTNQDTEFKEDYIELLEFLPEELSFTVLQDSTVTFIVFVNNVDSDLFYYWQCNNTVLPDEIDSIYTHTFNIEGNFNIRAVIYDLNSDAFITQNWFIHVDENPNISENIIPQITKLHQNFPNPFNPITTIRLDIKEQEKGILSIYNIKGQLIELKQYESGHHIYIWDATKQSSGIFLYKLQTDKIIETKKMLLLK